MDILFSEREPPRTFMQSDLIDSNGDLRRSVFDNAVSHLDPKSSPGYPFTHLEKNEEVDPLELYQFVNETLKTWDKVEPFNLVRLSAFNYADRVALCELAMLCGFSWPTSLFIKGEPTKEEKVARLIYAVSIVMNIIGRILFGDYLGHVKTTWTHATHKVGMDFSTQNGINHTCAYYQSMTTNTHEDGRDSVVADDIQGWEYQERASMHFTWHRCYLRAAKATSFHRRMQLCYAVAEHLSLMMDSDGYFHCKPFHTMDSGKITTHLQNSDERAALALMDYCMSRPGLTPGMSPAQMMSTSMGYLLPPQGAMVMTNGDDCVTVKGPGVPHSSTLGFVHTDIVECTPALFYFSSQKFYLDGVEWKRVPDSLAKSVFNILVCGDLSSLFDILAYIQGHEGFGAVVRYLQDRVVI